MGERVSVLPLNRGRDECNRENVKDAMRRVPVAEGHSKERGAIRAGHPGDLPEKWTSASSMQRATYLSNEGSKS